MNVQEAIKLLRSHWYECEAKYPAPSYWSCTPGHTHSKCEEGMALEKQMLFILKEEVNKNNTIT